MKTKKFFHSVPFKLSLRFSILLSVVTLVFSVAFTIMVSLVLRGQKSYELIDGADLVADSLLHDDDLEPVLSTLPYYMTYVVYKIDWDSNLEPKTIATNDPYLPCLSETESGAKKYYDENYFLDGALNILYYTKAVQIGEDFVFVQTALNMDTDSSSKIVRQIPKVCVIAFIPVLLLSFLFSMFITKRTIKPVVSMTGMARHIGSSNLDTMLPLSSSKVENQNELDELASTFNELFARLKIDFDREKQFTSDVSHELKTPVAVILGQSNLLRRWGKDDPVQLEKSLGTIIAETKSMEAIITNLLQMSRLESGRVQPNFEKVDVRALFERIKEETLSVNPDVEFEIEDGTETEGPARGAENASSQGANPLYLHADLELLHQVITVITSNSLKFCKFAGVNPIKIKCSADGASRGGERRGNPDENLPKTVCLSIQDNGPGFPDDAISHVFERFYRADSSHTRSAGGSGLGLSIAKTIVESMGGTITASNAAGGGAVITIELEKSVE
ncbi:MAG: HAMP domain-containing histidine kinase [Treponema sp.]|nr:HAMP domain-containing histidine kinase [Treponema sp.]